MVTLLELPVPVDSTELERVPSVLPTLRVSMLLPVLSTLRVSMSLLELVVLREVDVEAVLLKAVAEDVVPVLRGVTVP
jgi:hypothetical protein